MAHILLNYPSLKQLFCWHTCLLSWSTPTILSWQPTSKHQSNCVRV